MSKRLFDGSEDGNESMKKSRSGDSETALHVYQPCVPIPVQAKMNSLVEVLLPAKFLISDAKTIKLRQLWGTDVYSDDSDLVAVLVHTGHVKLKTAAPKSPLLITLRVCPAQATYMGSDRNGLRSRTWNGPHLGASYKVERCLQHTTGSLPPPELSLLRPGPSRQIPGSLNPQSPGPGQSFVVPPAACVVVFNLSNEPCYKYSLSLVADQSTESSRWTSTRLRREALYLESRHRRFELAHTGTKKGCNGSYDTYTLSQVRRAQLMDRRAMETKGVPLPAEHVKVLHEDVDWEEFSWGPCFLRVRGVEYPLVRLQYMPQTVAS
mmetsp:Transcript_36913/g.61169  ORF Transcript_36913/g.61169 Transcript_36913/m.61169 type:complete len:322 (-) Transcript_36913:240-1205(-)